MSVAVGDLYRMEMRARQHADTLRRRWPNSMQSDPSVHPDTQSHVRTQWAIADDFDQIGNLLVGLQADWATLAPKLRAGYLALQPPDKVEPSSEDAA